MKTTTISSKGQVTIPASLLRELGLAPGQKLLVVPVQDGLMLLRRPHSLADALAGATGGLYGDPDAYLRSERASWT